MAAGSGRTAGPSHPVRGDAPRPLRVLQFGTYDRGVGRNAILAEGLAAAGVTVGECHVPVWRDTAAKLDAVARPGALARAAARQAVAWPRLVGRYARLPDHDALVVGATAHLDVPLACWLARRHGRLAVFDPLVSIGETVRDRGLLPPASRRFRALTAVERALFRLPDVCLADTAPHADAFARELGVAAERLVVVPVGAPGVYRRRATPYDPGARRPVRVVYFGQFIPLHGVDVVVRAAHRLRERADVVFDLVGLGQTRPAAAALAAALGTPNVVFHPRWLDAEALIDAFIQPADICLGVFGAQPKAGLVVPYKVYAALAAGRAVVTGDTPAVRDLLSPGVEVCTVPVAADADRTAAGLAAAITRLVEDPEQRRRLAAAGQAAWDARFAPAVTGARLRDALVARVRRAGAHRAG